VDYLEEAKILKSNYHSERSFKPNIVKIAEGASLFHHLTVRLAKCFIHSFKTNTSSQTGCVK